LSALSMATTLRRNWARRPERVAEHYMLHVTPNAEPALLMAE